MSDLHHNEVAVSIFPKEPRAPWRMREMETPDGKMCHLTDSDLSVGFVGTVSQLAATIRAMDAALAEYLYSPLTPEMKVKE